MLTSLELTEAVFGGFLGFLGGWRLAVDEGRRRNGGRGRGTVDKELLYSQAASPEPVSLDDHNLSASS